MRLFRQALVMLAALATSLTMGSEAFAARIYDPVIGEFVEITPGVRSGRRSDKSPIKREVVAYDCNVAVGTIIVETSERRLYYVTDKCEAMKYGIGVGRDGFRWQGRDRISRKAEWPGWTPPEAMKKRQPGLPDYMPGGPGNPLGARALYIGSTLYRIHGTSEPWTIGQAVSSGCIRMANEDVVDLYNRVAVGARVVVRL